MKAFAAALGLLALGASPSHAQSFVCPSVSVGWALQYQIPPITSALYSQTTTPIVTLGDFNNDFNSDFLIGSTIVEGSLLYIIFNSVQATVFSDVPISVMQGLSRAANPLTFYQTSLYPQYHTVLLSEGVNCPLLNENGAYLWTK